MNGEFYHVDLNVSNMKKSYEFYDSFLGWLGYKRIYIHKIAAGWGTATCNFWLTQAEDRFTGHGFHRRRVGLNHIAFHADSRATVDQFYKQYLLPRKIPILYGGPKEYPEYTKGYYSVYFEDPDRLKLELAHVPKEDLLETLKRPIAQGPP